MIRRHVRLLPYLRYGGTAVGARRQQHAFVLGGATVERFCTRSRATVAHFVLVGEYRVSGRRPLQTGQLRSPRDSSAARWLLHTVCTNRTASELRVRKRREGRMGAGGERGGEGGEGGRYVSKQA